jgi:hypothetical protein
VALFSLSIAVGSSGFTATAVSPATIAYDGPPPVTAVSYGINTTYNYNYTFSVTNVHDSSPTAKELWIPTLSNETLLDATGNVYQQEFDVMSLTCTPNSTTFKSYWRDVSDVYGNEYYQVNFTLPLGEIWSMTVLGRFTSRTVTWNPNAMTTILPYNRTDPQYKLYTEAETMINKSFPAIASNASLLNSTNPFKTASNVYNFVANLLNYTYMAYDMGAEYAITYKHGDCTEFSYLMVALLRACGIPARDERGFVLADSSVPGEVTPNFAAPVGTTYNFQFNSQYISPGASSLFDNLTGHAWVQYFVPGYGWIDADPTWHNGDNYTAKIDNIHVPYTTGLWYYANGSGLSPVPPGLPEQNISTIPYPIYDDPYTYNTSYTFTVASVQVPPPWYAGLVNFVTKNPWLVLGVVIVIIAVIAIAVIIRHAQANRYRKKKHDHVSFS